MKNPLSLLELDEIEKAKEDIKIKSELKNSAWIFERI